MLDRQIRVNQAGDPLSQRTNGDGFVAAEVEDLAGCRRAGHQVQDAAHDVGDMGEAAHLLAVVVHDQRSPHQSLVDKARHDHAVTPNLARTDHVEESAHNDRQTRTLVITEREILVKGLAAGVNPAALGRRPQQQVILLR